MRERTIKPPVTRGGAMVEARAKRSPWVMVGWLSAIIGVLVIVFLATNMSKDPQAEAEERVPASAPQ